MSIKVGAIKGWEFGDSAGGRRPRSLIVKPDSSFVSLIAACSGVSPGSMCPPTGSHWLSFL